MVDIIFGNHIDIEKKKVLIDMMHALSEHSNSYRNSLYYDGFEDIDIDKSVNNLEREVILDMALSILDKSSDIDESGKEMSETFGVAYNMYQQYRRFMNQN